MTVFAKAAEVVESHGWRRDAEARGAFQTTVTLREALALALRQQGAGLDILPPLQRLEVLLEGAVLDVWLDDAARTPGDVIALLRRAEEGQP